MRLHFLLALLMGTLLMPPRAISGTFDNDITLGLGEEYNSNVNETPHAQADWASIASAVGTVKYEASRLTVNGAIDGSYNLYALGNRENEFKGHGKVKASLAVMPDTVFLEAEDSFQQVYKNLNRGATNSTDSTSDMTNQNTVTGRFLIMPRVADRLTLKLGAEINAIIYNSTELNKQIYAVFGEAGYALTTQLQLILNAEGKRQEPFAGGYDRVVVSGGFRWDYSSDGNILAMVGPRFTRYNVGDFIVDPYWNAKLVHSFGKLKLSADTSSIYGENPSNRFTTKTVTVGGGAEWKQDRVGLAAGARFSSLSGQAQSSSKQVSLSLTGSYELLPRLVLKAGGSRESSLTSGDDLVRWYANGSLNYEISDRFTVEGYYKWKLSGSNRGGIDNYNVNIVGLRFKRTF
ncbi:hypothetical protein [Fundidesulfovibrio terrae]|uniref:hypothetical protein n=1 Tax=Fundidesulfovibrio terrae TaxID=2922866 RepID=UPI001FAEE1FE|nr:hypothetical protein [Fundidesulfovibrio terrae]